MSSNNLSVLSKFFHSLVGLYIWEFLTTLDYEWSVIRGHRPHRWTIWLYSLTRVATLIIVILLYVEMDVTTPLNCEVMPIVQLVFSGLAFAAASLLIILRIVAIWNKMRVILWISIGLWMITNASIIQGVVRVKFVWMSTQTSCVAYNISSINLTFIVALATNFVLFFIMLIGLVLLRRDGGGLLGLGKLLWKQGAVWFFLVITGGLLQVVFFTDPLDAIFRPVSLVAMSIVAARIHRSLVEFVAGSTHIFRRGGHLISKSKGTPASRTSLSQMQVAMQISGSEFPMPGIGHPSARTASMSGEWDDTLNEPSVDNGPASDMER